jgi:hypothetical protein
MMEMYVYVGEVVGPTQLSVGVINLSYNFCVQLMSGVLNRVVFLIKGNPIINKL